MCSGHLRSFVFQHLLIFLFTFSAFLLDSTIAILHILFSFVRPYACSSDVYLLSLLVSFVHWQNGLVIFPPQDMSTDLTQASLTNIMAHFEQNSS